MPQYSIAYKARVLQRLVGPQAISAIRLAAEVPGAGGCRAMQPSAERASWSSRSAGMPAGLT
jgi:hypothetical protein